MKRFFYLLLLFNLSCQLIDQPEEIPSFIHINDFSFSVNNSNQGSNSEKIIDAWIYINGNLEGVYEMPATIPLHYQGVKNLSIYPGIKRNGISADRKKYPFYLPFNTSINLIPDSIIEINPSTEYEEDLFFWVEDFEDPQHKFQSHSTSQVDLSILDSPESFLFEGDAGIITMDSSQFYCEIRTNELDFNQFPKNLNIPAYIELNYANNFPFSLGILHKNASLPAYQNQALITMIPTFEDSVIWNKTYLYIPDATSLYSSATEFDIYISVVNDNYQNDIMILFDNFKVIYRP